MAEYFFKYNDIVVSDFPGFGVVMAEMPSIPDREISSTSIWQRSGEIFFSAKDSARTITVNINVRTHTAEDYIQTVTDLKTCFMIKEESQLFVGSEDLYINAVVSKYSFSDVFIADNSFYGEGIIEFYCADPYFYKGDLKYYDETSVDVLNNEGDIEAYPKIAVEFDNDATFLQLDSVNGSILLGNYPETNKTTVKKDSVVLDNECTSLENFISVGNVVDEGATGDTFVISDSGDRIEPNITSTGEGWHGACYRVNLLKDVKNFSFKSLLSFYANEADKANGEATTTGNYKVTASVSLRIRSGRGTKYKILGSMPSGTIVTVTDISSGWGKVTYNGITGYSSMTYLKAVNPSGTANNNYKTTANLNLRSGRSTRYRILITVPKGTPLTVSNIQGGWGKTTYKGRTGYVYMSYLTSLATASAITIVGKDESDTTESHLAANKLGLFEIYGFDSKGTKLFKCKFVDNNYYYEDSRPSIDIGYTTVLVDDSPKCPAPNTKKDDNGNYIPISSGRSQSAWNGFHGYFTVERNEDKWYLNIRKCSADNLNITIKEMSKGNPMNGTSAGTDLMDAKYPTTDLSYIVIYMAAYGSYDVETMKLCDIKITENGTITETEDINEIIFEQGDIVEIDCENNTVTKNGENILKYLDIGSEFFSIDSGETDIDVYSSTTDLSASISFRERFH